MSDSILVFEEDDTLRELLQDWLKIVFHRYEISEAKDKDEAISMAEAQSPRLILADVGLGGVEDVKTIRRLEAAASSAEIVALAMDDHKPVREAVTAAGARTLVSKWRIDDELLPALRDILTPDPARPRESTVA